MEQPITSRRSRAVGEELAGHGELVDASSGLPPWESFPAGDRHQVVHLLIQTARRQVPGQPTLPHPVAERR